MIKKLALTATLVAAVAVGGYLWKTSAPEPDGMTLITAAAADDAQTAVPEGTAADTPAAEPADTALPDVIDMFEGNPDAKVTVIEYGSFTCIHCAHFHNESYGSLKSDFIDTGKIKFIFREVYFDRFGLWAGMLARCQGPLKYFAISDLLYERRDDWIKNSDTEIADGLRKMGRIAGMTDDTINACLADSDKAKALVAEYQKNKEADGIEGTPTFLINGVKIGNPGYAKMKEMIQAELDK